MYAQRSITHISRQIIENTITNVYYITNIITLSSHKYSGNIKITLSQKLYSTGTSTG
jgi:hypothetical protein